MLKGVSLRSKILLLAALVTIEAREILRYDEGSSARQEQGVPGERVSGQWSWQAPDGKMKTIWYTADEMGFRAYGDSVHSTPWVSPGSQMPVIGSSVVPGISSKNPVAKSKLPPTHNSLGVPDPIAKMQKKPVQPKNLKPEERKPRLPPSSDPFSSLDLPKQIPGTSFIFLGTRKIPTEPRDPTGSTDPQPVKVATRPSSAVMGLLSDPKSKVTNIESLKNGKQLSNDDEPTGRRAPRPSLLEEGAEINLDNFLRPSRVVTNDVTPQNLDDYYYYDYDMLYDTMADVLNETASTASTTATTSTTTTTTTSTTTTSTTRKPPATSSTTTTTQRTTSQPAPPLIPDHFVIRKVPQRNVRSEESESEDDDNDDDDTDEEDEDSSEEDD